MGAMDLPVGRLLDDDDDDEITSRMMYPWNGLPVVIVLLEDVNAF